jgi:copper(I)-binding protein
MRNHTPSSATLALALLAASPALAADVSVTNGWFRALPAGLPAGGYFSLHNGGATPVALIAAQSSACGMLMMHRSTESGGMSRMEDVPSVTVPAAGTIDFAPGGYHLMCMHPGSSMMPGQRVPVTLSFSNHAQVNAEFAVKSPAGQ